VSPSRDPETRRRIDRKYKRARRTNSINPRVPCPHPDCSATPPVSPGGKILRHFNDLDRWCDFAGDLATDVPEVRISRETLLWLVSVAETAYQATPDIGCTHIFLAHRALGTVSTYVPEG
jgi:hypothetical protein